MKHYFKRIVVIVLIGMALFSLYKIGDYVLLNARFDEALEDIQRQHRKSHPAASEKQMAVTQADEQDADRIRFLQASYPDLVGWIAIEGTDIDFPLMYSENNYFYLEHNYQGDYHPFGTPYIDAANRMDFTDQNTVIYGHNVRSGKVFHDLTSYMEKGFVDKAPEIAISTTRGILRYEIFAAYVANPYDNFRSPSYGTSSETAFLERIQKNNVLDKTVPNRVENFLTLQTCLDNDKRLVIHGQLKK
ncbi:class B sortase [Peptoniphilus equinus]|uniref:Class B sortase n=1 Tax=Peptoniphilus equinus TaxID=3016343 RepID=A0ABY7QT44_9FIRM|nr:class B sortase [Peptoniphilus equinus]WBW49902.1 class B sortase [Peptoniphilus equinus]